MDKLIFVGLNTKNIECAYIPADLFSKLMAKGFVRWDGMWLKNPVLWPLFFERLGAQK